MGWMEPGAAELPATMTLPRTLQPGRHSLFVKGYNYGHPINVKLSIGGGTTVVAADDRDSNGAWSISAPLTIRTASNQLTLTLQKAGPRSDFGKFLLRGLYVTANANETVLESDAVVDLRYPTQMDSSQAQPGNLLENSSFETGFGHGWGLSENRQFSLRSIWDDTQGHNGGASVKLPLNPGSRSYGKQIGLVSKVYGVRPNKTYTLSAWLKTDPGATAAGSLSLINSFSDRHLMPARSRHRTASSDASRSVESGPGSA